VLGQTRKDFEFVIVDDGSTDRSLEILRKYAASDSRIILIECGRRGVAAASNLGIERASGDLVLRFDCDDVMLPSRLERQGAFMMEHPELSASCGYAHLTDRHGRRVGSSKPKLDLARGWRERNALYILELIHPASAFRKTDFNAVGGYSEAGSLICDRDLWAKFILGGFQIGIQPEFLIEQSLHSASIMVNRVRHLELVARLIDENLFRRRDGERELTYDEFLVERRRRSVIRKLLDWRYDTAKIFYRAATRRYAERDWVGFISHAGIGVALSPIAVPRRMLAKGMAR
jgi:glycosyltransferase involved in cell wall biosynthesis